MSQFNDTGYGTVTLSATVAQHLRVTPAGAVGVLTTAPFGTARVAGASGDVVGVVYANKQGTTKMVASKAIAAGVKVYSTAAGKVTDTFASTGFLEGIAVEQAFANNDVIEVLRVVSGVTGE
jgi:hypothetical protein